MAKRTRKSSKSSKTKKQTSQTKQSKHDSILHHHLLIRCELGTRLLQKDTARLQEFLDDITRDIHMKKLGATQTFWVDGEHISQQGITGLNVIETSHIAAHVWNFPEHRILHHHQSRALMQFDIYTCARLTNQQIIAALEHLSQFTPTHATITLLNRKWSLTIDRHMSWTKGDETDTWQGWLEKQKITRHNTPHAAYHATHHATRQSRKQSRRHP